MPETALQIAPPSSRPHKRVGPYSKHGAVALLDGRSREAQYMRARRAELVAHVGTPSAVQRQLIERCAWLSLHLAMLDAKVASGQLTEHDSNEYLAWSNSLARTLRLLGLQAAAQRPPSLAEVLAQGRAVTA